MEPLRGDEVPSVSDRPLVSRAVRIPTPSRRALLEATSPPRVAWIDPDGTAVVGEGAVATIVARGPDRFADVRAACKRLFDGADVAGGTDAARPRVFGGFAFHDESTLGPPWTDFPDAQFVLPRTQVTWADGSAWVTVNGTDDVEQQLASAREALTSRSDPGPVDPPPGIETRERTPERSAWRRTVRAATERIQRGELRKVVLAQSLELGLASAPVPADVLTRLGRANPDCYRFLVGWGPTSLVGASPERLVSLRERTVETGALAGTTGRGDTHAEDEQLASELASDRKNGHEHDLVAEAIGEQLRPFASTITTGDRRVRRLATVQHLETPISAELATDEHVLTLVEALHPTPAVGGLPQDRALAAIRETEPFERGWYAAPVGWIDAAGDGTFAVAIRSAVTADDTATLFAGVGIVEDSDPDREWDEVQLKYRPLLNALA